MHPSEGIFDLYYVMHFPIFEPFLCPDDFEESTTILDNVFLRRLDGDDLHKIFCKNGCWHKSRFWPVQSSVSFLIVIFWLSFLTGWFAFTSCSQLYMA